MSLTRRALLQSLGCLTALGVGEVLLGNCRSVLAAPAPRKVAILIGINDYPKASLKGAVTDVMLQENLLRYRFGFQPQDIFKFTNQAATATAVTQLLNHELQQLQSEDLVVLHFSGKGGISFDQQPVLMMANDSTIAWEELARLLQACPTRKILTVLDTSYQPSLHKMQGTGRVRSMRQDDWQFNQEDVHEVTMEALPGMVPGVVISVVPSQFAVETDYADFSAGQLTYAFTQALWRSSTVEFKHLIPNHRVTGRQTEQGAIESLAIESLLSKPSLPASLGSLTTFDPATKTGEIWLGGIPSHQIVAFGSQSVLQSSSGQVLQILSRQGLKAKVRLQEPGLQSATEISTHDAFQEQIRVIPKSLPLEIAIDTSLPKLERVDAVGAFANIPNVVTKVVGEGPVDYLLAKVPQPNTVVAALPDAPVSDVVPSSQYGLFKSGQAQIATATGLSGEAIKSTVKRISPIVQSLYGAKILSLLENQASSGMSVGMQVESLSNKSQPLMRQGTAATTIQALNATSIPLGSQIRYQVLATAIDRPYWLFIGWNSRQEMDILVPAADRMVFEGIAHEPIGEVTLYLLASDRPFTQTLKHLSLDSHTTTLLPLPQPLGAIQALMQDLAVDEVEGSYRFDVDRYAVIRLSYQLTTV